MTTPTPERPMLADDLDQAYARAHALAGVEPGPAASVRAKVLAAAQEIAAQAGAKPPLAPVAAPVSDVGRGRAGAWNLSSWRVRSGAAFCAVLLVGLAVVRFDASRHGAGNVMVAAADAPLSVNVVPASPPMPVVEGPPPPKMMVPSPVMVERQAAMPAAPVAIAPAATVRDKDDGAALAQAAGRDPERVVAQADPPARARATIAAVATADRNANADKPAAFAEAPSARRDSPTLIAGQPPSAIDAAPTLPAPALSERRLTAAAAPAPAPALTATAPPAPAAPAPAVAAADNLQRVEITGSSLGFSSAAASQAMRGAADSAKKVSPAAVGSAIGAVLRPQSTPLHVAANADDVDALRKLLADPAARVDATDADGRTPLMVAVMAANVRAVRMLLDAGADPEHADSSGATPRSVARTGPSAEIAALLAVRR